jgi:Terminase small subunit
MPRRVRKRGPSAKERAFAEGVAAGLSDKRAALRAGYSESMASATKARIWSKPEVQEYFAALVQQIAPPERIVRRLSDHIDGKILTTRIRKRTVPSADGKGDEVEETIVERVESVDAAVSLRACEMAATYGGYAPDKGPLLEVGVNMTLEQALITAGETWEPPTWAQRQKAGA